MVDQPDSEKKLADQAGSFLSVAFTFLTEASVGGSLYSLLADAVVVVHFLFIAFVVVGGLLVLRRPGLAFLHLPAVAWGAGIEFTGGICPLTPLENHLRFLGGQSAYSGDFVARYLLPVIYPSNLTTATQYILGALVIVINLIIYTLVLRRHSSHKK